MRKGNKKGGWREEKERGKGKNVFRNLKNEVNMYVLMPIYLNLYAGQYSFEVGEGSK